MAAVGLREWLAVGDVIRQGQLQRYGAPGAYAAKFEARLARHVGVRHALGVNSGTSGLISALAAVGVGPGDEVLVPAYTWMSTAAAPVWVGAVPVLVDIDETLTMDPDDIVARITPRTRAIIPVHMVNLPANMAVIREIARRRNLRVIEDASQAVGVRYGDEVCGGLGDIGVYSFNSFKNINIGEGGAILTNSDKYFARARNMHDLGVMVRKHQDNFNEPAFVGMNMRITEVDGAMLNVQLDRLGPMLSRLKACRRVAAEEFLAAGFTLVPHHDEANAVSLVVLMPSAKGAEALATFPRMRRLYDNSKHVYTNWDAIVTKRTFDPRVDPWAHAEREIGYDAQTCWRTLEILKRACLFDLGTRLPAPLVGLQARRVAQAARATLGM